MKLTSEQIDRLYQFTIQHYVEYYDLQTELVDHLANSIEKQWQENPNISFEDALQTEFKKFGIFGFTGIVEKRQAALNQKYNLIVWGHLKSFFTVPKIFATLISVGMVFKLLEFFNPIEDFIQYIITILLIILGSGLLVRFWNKKKKYRLSGKKWLFDEVITGHKTVFVFSNFFLQMALRLFSGANNGDFVLCLGSLIIVSFIILIYIVLFLIPSKAEEYLKETYPEYEISK